MITKVHALAPKKSLGQNFLHDQVALQVICDVSHITPEDTIIEIGPGTGNLTEKILGSGARIIVIEKDARAIPILEKRFKEYLTNKQLHIIEGDALDLVYSDLPKQAGFPSGYKIIANIPYYITGKLLRHMTNEVTLPKHITLLMQREVAERITGRGADTDKQSILSLSLTVYGTPKYIQTVKPGAFHPQPGVDSAIMTLENISRTNFTKYNITEEAFFTLIKTGFSSKRKKLYKNLQKIYSQESIKNAFDTISLDLDIRSEQVDLDMWCKLCAAFAN